MNHYIIDGNNLIGKIKHLHKLQKKDKKESRTGLVNILNKFLSGKKVSISLHLDGYPNEPINLLKGTVIYSKNHISDKLIKEEINNTKNPRLIILITSDGNLMNYGKVCSCTVIKSEDFLRAFENTFIEDDEEYKIKQLEKERSEFEKLFGSQKD